jgi:hypothetical protein
VSDSPKLNDLGQVAFNASSNTVGYGSSGIWLFDHGQISPVVVGGQAATAIGANRAFGNFGEIVLNNSGAMAFQAHARLPDVNQPWSSAVWEFRNGIVNAVVAAGATVPARAGNRVIDSYTDPSSYSVPFGRIAINIEDDVLFTAKLNTGGYGGDPTQDSGIWKARGTSVSLVNQEKSTGFRDSDFVDRGVAPSVNGRGHVAFGMCTAGDSRCWSGGAWISDGNTLTPLALIGQTVTIDGHDYTFTGAFGLTAMNDNDQVAFAADYLDSLTGVTQPGIWLSSAGDLQLIGGIFDGLPGLYPSQSIYGNYPPSGITINNRGQVAFETGLGIWATDRAGVLRLVAIRGQRIDIDNGPGENWQTIDGFRANLNDRDSGRAQGFNDRGELVFQVQYSLYSTAGGVFLSRVATIPEPSTGTLSGLFLAMAAGWRLRRAKQIGSTT